MTTTAPPERNSLLPRLLGGLGRRVVRLRPSLIPRSYLVLVIACWVATLVMAALILVPGLSDVLVAPAGSDPLGSYFAPLAFRMTLVICIAILAIAGGVIVLLRARVRHHGLGRRTPGPAPLQELAILALAGFPALALAADRSWVAALWALGLLLVAEVVVHSPLATNPDRSLLVPGLAIGAPWAVVAVAQYTPLAAFGSWEWLGLFWVGASFAAFSAFYAVGRVAESRGRGMVFLFRNDIHPLVVIAVVLLSAGVLAVRLTIARDLFNPTDASIWVPFVKQPVSWALATVVAGLICVIAVRATRRPMARLGERRVIAGIAAIGNIAFVIALGVIVISMVVSAVWGVPWGASDWVDADPALQFFLILGLGVLFLVLPVFRGTAARAVALVSVVYLAPALGLIAYVDVLPLWVSVATPVQVAMELVAAALALALWNLVRPARRVAPSVIVRLAVVPVLALHAGLLLPAAWTSFGRIVIVAAVVAALFLFMPKVAADPRRHALNVLRASWLQLLVLVVYALAAPTLFADQSQSTLGVLWLSVAVMAALSFNTLGPEGAVDVEDTD